MSGVEILKQLHRDHPNVVVVLMSAFANVPDAVEAMKLGPRHYLSQPLDIDALKMVIERARSANLNVQRPGFENILGHSKELLEVLD